MSAAHPLHVIVQGLGPIGKRILAAAQADPQINVLAVVDVAETLVGRDASGLIEGAPALVIHPSVEEARDALPRSAPQPEAVLHATGSTLDGVSSQLEENLHLRLHVISTCEELAYPFVRHHELAQRLDQHALALQRSLIGTGVNPGFVMDQIVVAAAGASHNIRSVEVRRVQNPGPRRESFRKKVGMNMPRLEYENLAASGTFGHVGMVESGRLIAAGLGWEINNWAERLKPVHPEPHGLVLGTVQVTRGTTADGRIIHLHFEAHSGVRDNFDEIEIQGTPPLKLRFIGGVFGEDATAAAVLRVPLREHTSPT
jgi:hypothetical protein